MLLPGHLGAPDPEGARGGGAGFRLTGIAELQATVLQLLEESADAAESQGASTDASTCATPSSPLLGSGACGPPAPPPLGVATAPGGAAGPCNPGSVGHPNICMRPCLYIASGTCNNGAACRFCHIPHNNRPARLDKRNRALIQKMTFSECAAHLLPVMQEKAQDLGIKLEGIELLQHMADLERTVLQLDSTARGLNRSLSTLNLRALLAILRRKISDENPEAASLCRVDQAFRDPAGQIGL